MRRMTACQTYRPTDPLVALQSIPGLGPRVSDLEPQAPALGSQISSPTPQCIFQRRPAFPGDWSLRNTRSSPKTKRWYMSGARPYSSLCTATTSR